MSKTDKTKPGWLKLKELWAINQVQIIHNCSGGEDCQPQVWMPAPRQGRVLRSPFRGAHCYCGPPAQTLTTKIYGRRPKKATRKEMGFEGAIRAELRKLSYKWRHTTDREAIDSSWGAPRKHCQVRDPSDWD